MAEGDYYNLGLDSDNGGSGWLLDAWGDVKDVLRDGISIWQDVENIKNPPIVYTSNPDAYTTQFAPVDENTIANAQVRAQTWVPGLSNGVVAVGIGLLLLTGLVLANR